MDPLSLLLNFLIVIVVLFIVIAVLRWMQIPEPWPKIIIAIFALLCLIWLIGGRYYWSSGTRVIVH